MFPLGVLWYIVGGILVGLGVATVFIGTGLHATASSLFDSTLSYFSRRSHFRRKENIDSRDWRLTLAFGMIIGALLCTLIFSGGAFFVTTVQWWRLAIGGFLVGFGTRLSQGCTSGHGISGLASLSSASLFAVITFLSVGILTALIIHSLGVVP